MEYQKLIDRETAEKIADIIYEEILMKSDDKNIRINPIFIEKMNKRLNLRLETSLYEKLKRSAYREGRSMNDKARSILAEALKGEQ